MARKYADVWDYFETHNKAVEDTQEWLQRQREEEARAKREM